MSDFTKEPQRAIAILKEGTKSDFWKIIIEALEDSRHFIEEQQESEDMQELLPEQYKFTNELYKAKKEFLSTLIKTPENIVSWLESPPEEREKEFDPYDKG